MKKFYYGCNFTALVVTSIYIFAENWLEWIYALVAVFWTNIEISLYDSKQAPKWRYLVDIFFETSQQQKFILIGKKISLKSCFSYFSCWISRSKNLISSCESSWNENAKIGIWFVCSSNTSWENQQNAFIDLNRTVLEKIRHSKKIKNFFSWNLT